MANSSCLRKPCKIVSYNLHGLNSGRSLLYDLCQDDEVAIIAVQEHWLSKDNLHQMNNVHDDFLSVGVSGMCNRLSSEIYMGRPFGGVGFLFRKHLAGKLDVVDSSDDGRCLIVSLKLSNTLCINIVNAYFPCADGSVKYRIELGNCLGFIESVISQNGSTIILGDMNFQCTDDSVGFGLCSPVFRQLDLYNCDTLCSAREQFTYHNEALNKSSFIDHIFVSRQIFQDCCNVDIIDSGCNLSDHRPIVAKFNFVLDLQARDPNYKASKCRILNWRWDKSDLSTYYEESRSCLSNISVIPTCTRCIDHMCYNYSHHVNIDHYYRDIMNAIHVAACKTVVRIPHKSLKPFWNEELDKLKQDYIFWYNVWASAGKPHQRILRNISISCKLKYKTAIRDAYSLFSLNKLMMML